MTRERSYWLWCMVLATTVALTVTSSATAQVKGFEFRSLTVSSGDDPISSGITGIVQFSTKRNFMAEVAVQHEQAWFLSGREFKLGVVDATLAGSIGHFQGSPWVGPFLTLSVPITKVAGRQVSVSTMQWPGLFFWEPKNWDNGRKNNPERFLIGYLGSFQIDVGPVGFTYGLLDFLDDKPNKLIGGSYTQKINGDFVAIGKATWSVNDERWLLYVGVTWKPNHKGS
ncbi:MAG: hypothetical protein AAB864_02370 [Patescibacteria group bacterium]